MSSLGAFLFVVALLFSIGLHELGHLGTAKMFGIKVQQYFIGFGPKIWSTFRGETEYGVKALPLGGFVRIAGMNPFEEIPPEDAGRVFKAKKPWQRAIVLAAGSFTHFVLAIVILVAVLAATGKPEAQPVIGRIADGVEGRPAPSTAAGFEEGDRFVEIDGIVVTSWDQMVELLHDRPGETVEILVERDGERLTLRPALEPAKPDGTPVGYLGVGPALETVPYSFGGVFVESGKQFGEAIVGSLKGLQSIFSPSSLNRIFSQIAGDTERTSQDPATIVGLTDQAGNLASTGDFTTFFLLIAAFNIFIGVANLLPLPPLDGGHLAVLAFEKVSRKDVDMRKLLPVTATVIFLFGSLFFMLLWLDITNPLPAIPG
ncbi:MAG TPA: M50 family metallopeptidase [Actinomycetota bacterium]